jgi:phosphoenolpyruvate synthase/pyruvate phosphate dikinase
MYTKRLEEAPPPQSHEVGGKAANLAKLINAGLPVPAGFCVTTKAYEEHLNVHNIQAILDEELADIDRAERRGRQNLGAEIRGAILNAPLPDTIRAEIDAALNEVGWGKQAVVVRSSSTSEDGARASYAGQHDSYLNVSGDDQIAQAVRACWASLWTRRAILYRLGLGLMHRPVSMAVVIQMMLRPDVSGVVFTADPITGNRSEAVITASFGLPDTIVSGIVSPDEFRVSKEDFRITSKRISDKKIESVPVPGGGTERRPVSGDRRQAEVLTESQVHSLISLTNKVERHFGEPQDVEWCLESDRLWILQSRPMSFSYVGSAT